MNMEKMTNEIDANARCMKEFADFLKEARPKHLNTLRRVLREFNDRVKVDCASNIDPEERWIGALAVSSAKKASRRFFDGVLTSRDVKNAYDMGYFFEALVSDFFRVGADEDIELLLKFLRTIHYPHQQQEYARDKGDRSLLVEVMRKLVAERDAANEPATSLVNLSKSLKKSEKSGTRIRKVAA